MPAITVSAILLDQGRILLARTTGESEWVLPGGMLTDADDEIEDALVRVLATGLGVQVIEARYLDTLYERAPDGVVVHNVFFVGQVAGELPEDGVRQGMELRWTETSLLKTTPLPDWLIETLLALLAGRSAPGPDIDLPGFAAESGVRALPVWLTAPRAAPVIVVSGPSGAGKSTVARLLCERFPKAAHVDVDLLRWQMLPSGYVRPEAASGHKEFEYAPPDAREARRQLDLAALNASTVARNFAVAGFTAVIDGVLEHREELDVMLTCLSGLDVAFVTLMPDVETLRSRDEGRDAGQFMGERALDLHRIMSTNGESRGVRLDTAGQTAEETVELVLRRLDDAMVQFAWEMSE